MSGFPFPKKDNEISFLATESTIQTEINHYCNKQYIHNVMPHSFKKRWWKTMAERKLHAKKLTLVSDKTTILAISVPRSSKKIKIKFICWNKNTNILTLINYKTIIHNPIIIGTKIQMQAITLISDKTTIILNVMRVLFKRKINIFWMIKENYVRKPLHTY